MSKIKRWLDKRRVVWTEPALPKYVKINPLSPPGAAQGIQPGDFSMLQITEEFLDEAEDFPEAPEEGLALPWRILRVLDARTAGALDLPIEGALLARPDGGELRQWPRFRHRCRSRCRRLSH